VQEGARDMMSELHAAIAATRFGLGAKPGEIDAARRDPQAWLLAQLDAPGAPLPGAPGSRELLATTRDYLIGVRELQSRGGDVEAMQREARRALREPRVAHILARTEAALAFGEGFRERWIRFWSNHFSVSATTAQNALVAPSHEAEAIRTHAFGSFETLLIEAELHPAMLVYLDNQASVGPNSRAGRRSGRGLNENHAREILELHTLGVDGGYTQGDVEAFARILTGWTVGRPRIHGADRADESLFDERLHEPGAHVLLGRRFAGGGPEKARDALRFLAEQPRTIRFIAAKLARHFFADTPDEADIAHIETAWTASGGDLKTIARAVVTAPSAWAPQAMKFKTPEEFLVSVLRGMDMPPPEAPVLAGGYQAIGQPPFTAPSPQGWPDLEEAWAGPDAILKRVEYVNALARRLGPASRPRERGPEILGARLSARTAEAVSRAESPEQGLVLLFMSPDFLRR